MNVLELAELAIGATTMQPVATTLADAGLLYVDYQDFKAGKLKIATLAATGNLVPMMDAFAREAVFLANLVRDPKERAKIVDLATENGL